MDIAGIVNMSCVELYHSNLTIVFDDDVLYIDAIWIKMFAGCVKIHISWYSGVSYFNIKECFQLDQCDKSMLVESIHFQLCKTKNVNKPRHKII